MKALELRTWPLWESLGGTMYAGESAEDVVNVDYEVYRKRFTDEEMAAEFWRISWATERDHLEFEDQMEVLYRFATLPHYDDPTETGNKR